MIALIIMLIVNGYLIHHFFHDYYHLVDKFLFVCEKEKRKKKIKKMMDSSINGLLLTGRQ